MMDKKLTANEEKSKYINPLVKVEQNTCIMVLLITKPALVIIIPLTVCIFYPDAFKDFLKLAHLILKPVKCYVQYQDTFLKIFTLQLLALFLLSLKVFSISQMLY